MKIANQAAVFVVKEGHTKIQFGNGLELPFDHSSVKWWAFGTERGLNQSVDLHKFAKEKIKENEGYSIQILSGELMMWEPDTPMIRDLNFLFLDF